MTAGFIQLEEERRHTWRVHFWRWTHGSAKQAVVKRGTDDRGQGQSFQGLSLPVEAEKWGWGSQGKLLLFCFASVGTNISRLVCKPRMSLVTNETGSQGDTRQGGLSKTFKAIEFWLEQWGTVESLSRTVWQEKNYILKTTSCLWRTQWIEKEPEQLQEKYLTLT